MKDKFEVHFSKSYSFPDWDGKAALWEIELLPALMVSRGIGWSRSGEVPVCYNLIACWLIWRIDLIYTTYKRQWIGLAHLIHWTPLGIYTVPKYSKFASKRNWILINYVLNGFVIGTEWATIISLFKYLIS